MLIPLLSLAICLASRIYTSIHHTVSIRGSAFDCFVCRQFMAEAVCIKCILFNFEPNVRTSYRLCRRSFECGRNPSDATANMLRSITYAPRPPIALVANRCKSTATTGTSHITQHLERFTTRAIIFHGRHKTQQKFTRSP